MYITRFFLFHCGANHLMWLCKKL